MIYTTPTGRKEYVIYSNGIRTVAFSLPESMHVNWKGWTAKKERLTVMEFNQINYNDMMQGIGVAPLVKDIQPEEQDVPFKAPKPSKIPENELRQLRLLPERGYVDLRTLLS